MNILLGALALLLSSALWLHFILKKDRIEREPLVTFILVGLGGGLISTVLALFSGVLFSSATGIRFVERPLAVPDAAFLSVFVGFSEEFFKCLAAMLLMRKLKEFDEPADGVIYAMAVSLGFAAIENIGYMARGGVAVIVSRTFLSVPAHLGFGALWGTGLAAAKFGIPKSNPVRVVTPFLVVSALCHGLYDFCFFAFLPMRVPVAVLIVLLLWSYASRKIKFLVAHSPFIPPGRCPECAARSKVDATRCASCGATIYPDSL